MGRAIVIGAVKAGIMDAAHTLIAEPDPQRRHAFTHPPDGVPPLLALPTAALALGRLLELELEAGIPGQILLAVKPQMLNAVAAEVAALGPAALDRVVISILAGASTERLSGALGMKARIVRVMPNLAVEHLLGMSAVALGRSAAEADARFAQRLFDGLGRVVRIEESLMDAFTALAGSGPAYLFHLAEAMTRAGAALGFDPEQADAIVRQTIGGAAAMLRDDPRSAGELRAAVTSKGGTTAAALAVIDAADNQGLWLRAISAARDRGRELAG